MYPVHVELAAASAESRQCETVPVSEILGLHENYVVIRLASIFIIFLAAFH